MLLVGTGRSLCGFDFTRLRGLGTVVAVKESILDLPFADACFGLDLHWMKRRHDLLADIARRMEVYLATVEHQENIQQTPIDGVTYLRRLRSGGLSLDPYYIQSGGTSGYGALNLAVLKRAREIVLFGFDYTSDHYCHERYPGQSTAHNSAHWPKWAECFRDVLPTLSKLGVNVINASPTSNLTVFKRFSLEEVVQHLDRLRSERDRRVCGGQAVDHPAPDLTGADHGADAPASSGHRALHA